MPRQRSAVNGVASSNHYVDPRHLRRQRSQDSAAERPHDIESWRDNVDKMRTKSRLCERGRLYNHLDSKSVLDRAIEALTSHTAPMYRPEGRGRRGCFGGMEKAQSPETKPRTTRSTGDVESDKTGSKTSFSYHSPSRTTVTTIKEFIYNDAGFPRPTYVEDVRRTKSVSDNNRRSSKILEKEINDIVDRRRHVGEKQPANDTKIAYSNLPNADTYEFVAAEVEPEKKPKKKKKNLVIRPAEQLDGDDVFADTGKAAAPREKSKSTVHVKFEDEQLSVSGGGARKQTIDWGKVNKATGTVEADESDQKLIKTFARLYTDKSFGDSENIDREVSAYKTSGRATLGQIEEPDIPVHLRKREI